MSMTIHHRKRSGIMSRVRYGKHAGRYIVECGREFDTDLAVTRERDAVTCESCLQQMRARGDFAPSCRADHEPSFEAGAPVDLP